MDYDEDKIRKLVISGLKNPDPWRVELESIDYGARLGVFYRSVDGIKRVSVDTIKKTEEQIAFGLLSVLMSQPDLHEITDLTCKDKAISPYEGRRGKHPKTCTCSKHKAVDGAQAA